VGTGPSYFGSSDGGSSLLSCTRRRTKLPKLLALRRRHAKLQKNHKPRSKGAVRAKRIMNSVKLLDFGYTMNTAQNNRRRMTFSEKMVFHFISPPIARYLGVEKRNGA
jgi:hypothetical protein